MTRLDLVSSQLTYSTFLGGSREDFAQAMAVTENGDVIVAGKTSSIDFPVSPGAYDTQHAGGGPFGEDIFIAKVDHTGSTVLWATFLGGAKDEEARDLVIGPWGDIFITGESESSDFPQIGRVVAPALGSDVVVARLDSSGSELLYSTLLASEAEDEGWGIQVLDNGSAILTGTARGRDFPTTEGAYDTRGNRGPEEDIFLTRLPTGPVLHMRGTPSAGSTVHFELRAASPLEVGHSVLLALSGSGTAGIPLPGGWRLPLTFDAFTSASLAAPGLFQGIIAPDGSARLPDLTVPPISTGTTIWSAALTWDPNSGMISSVSCPLETVVQ